MGNKLRYLVKIIGIVQGVGFRPFVYNQAILFQLCGWVSNQGGMVLMDVEGEKNNLKLFLLKVKKEPPKLAVIDQITLTKKEIVGYETFTIRESKDNQTDVKLILSDIGTCSECINEILDPKNPRYRYAFTNCTSCGPRYSIIKRLPYDRSQTTMNPFVMCPSCKKEYEDPHNRRFHAQPNCCPQCGPKLKLMNNNGEEIKCEDAIQETIQLLKNGSIFAIKGLGGFHLACDAMNERTIEILRQRKNRPHKPFAIMMKDLELIRKLCSVNREEETLLLSPKRPIVLLQKKNQISLPFNIAPNLNTLGIMLPYTPIHHLLFEGDLDALVMTSANISSAPIEFKNIQAFEKLKPIADFFLVHDREIHVSIEDSVVKVVNHREMVVRRARGYSPYALNLKINADILALGSEEKGNFSLSHHGYGYLSQYLGDLSDYDVFNNYQRVLKHMEKIIGVNPHIIAHDLRFEPSEKGEKDVPIQHHHAHMVSCMVEHQLNEQTIGVIYDGTGLGTDGTIWGGEVLIGNREKFIRVGHFKQVLIQGGDSAIYECWKIAFSYLHAMNLNPKTWIKGLSDTEYYVMNQALNSGLNCFTSSSVGRLFDCVAVLLTGCNQISYQAQGAIELESMVNPAIIEIYQYQIEDNEGIFVVDYQELINGILFDLELGKPNSEISTKFHNTIGKLTIELIDKISHYYDIYDVVLSGGVFENTYLLNYVLNNTRECQFKIYYNQQIPINDSGISIGQLAIASALERT